MLFQFRRAYAPFLLDQQADKYHNMKSMANLGKVLIREYGYIKKQNLVAIILCIFLLFQDFFE